MIRVVADTHALVWALANDSRLSPAARAAFSPGGNDTVGVSSISLAELLYLEEKSRLPAGTPARLKSVLGTPAWALEEVPFSLVIVDAMARLPRDQVPDLPDRIIAATALHLGVPLVTRDRQITATGIATIW
jgi:PIN domain nuclease of toxin-antitoxin system